MGGTREAVPAGVRAAAESVDGVLKRQDAGIGNLVDRRLAQDFVKSDTVKLWRADASHQSDAVQTRQRAILGAKRLPVPTHAVFEHIFDKKSTDNFRNAKTLANL